jgi:Rab-GTPase-TBC domain
MSTQPKGLPGFLRRSLRIAEEEVAEIADSAPPTNDSVVNEGATNIGRSYFEFSVGKPPLPENRTPTGTPMATPAPTPSVSKPTRHDLLDFPPLALEQDPDPEPSVELKATLPKADFDIKPAKTYKDRQLDAVLLSDIVNMTDLRTLCWNGIPPRHRAQAWKILLGYLPTNNARRTQTLARKRAEYKDAILQHYDIDDDVRTVQEQETLRQVLVDVPRTAPEVGLFRNDRIRKALSRLLFVWAMRHPASSYVQGINDLATPLIVVFLANYFQESSMDDILNGTVMNQVTEEMMEEVRFLSCNYFHYGYPIYLIALFHFLLTNYFLLSRWKQIAIGV